MRDDSGTLAVNSPVARFTVPVVGAAKVFSTQVDRPALGMGSGGPKRQPVFVQSMPPPAPVLGSSGHSSPVHAPSTNRLVAPSGIAPSGTRPFPAPMSSPPHAIARSGAA